MVELTNEIQSHSNAKRRCSKAAKIVTVNDDDDASHRTDQSMCKGGTKIMLRRTKKSFAKAIRNSFRGLSKRSLFGEGRSVIVGTTHHEESIDFDVNSDEDEIKAPVIKTKKLMKAAGESEECTVTTKESASTEEAIPRFIYVVNGSILTNLGKRNPLKRIQRSFRKIIPKQHEFLDESDEEAFDQTLVEL